ncbi:MAG: tRNA1(Val) (adenine(37)-N6)-methyltransferase [Christensenellales bacterium]|jgi:tRNA1Val (adenine37-N6)-methyltransferase
MAEIEAGQLILPGERIDDLQREGLRIIQHPKSFCFGMDAVLLSDFARLKPGSRVVDLGTGTGILPLLLSAKSRDTLFTGVEIMPEAADRARRSVALNGLEHRIGIETMDLRQAPLELGKGRFHALVCNPPYKRIGDGKTALQVQQAAARHEVYGTLEDMVCVSAQLLMNRGRAFYILHSDRFLELLFLMHTYGLEPKRLRMIHPFVDRPPNLMLAEGVRGGKPLVHWLSPLILYEKDGSETQELRRIYNKEAL